MKNLGILVYLTLLCAPAGFSQTPSTIEARPEYPEGSSTCLEYLVAGRSVEGRLVAYEFMPSGWLFPPSEQRDGEGDVFLRQYLWFPNPFSSPGVVVAVTEPSSFSLELFDETAMQIEKFEFNDIETGVYFFALKDPIFPVRRCTVRLMLNGVPAGEIESRTDRGSYNY